MPKQQSVVRGKPISHHSPMRPCCGTAIFTSQGAVGHINRTLPYLPCPKSDGHYQCMYVVCVVSAGWKYQQHLQVRAWENVLKHSLIFNIQHSTFYSLPKEF